MGTKESVIYGYNNENHKDKDFKKQEFSLGLGMYYIHVILGGVNLQQIDFWFSIWRDTISGKLEINSTK
jgi:hypothetical protein